MVARNLYDFDDVLRAPYGDCNSIVLDFSYIDFRCITHPLWGL